MLPINLTLRNFLSYKEAAPTLRLEDIHVACLCGANGMGKSALLDAITWVLWGHARGQRQEQLLHHGQQDMSVELEFAVGEERYRVTRRYSRARRTPQSSLELAVLSGSDYRPVTGDTIGETQADIIRRVNMDYDTFVNSAFLVQGRADLFTMATPSQRKEVLARVLGLGLYDRLEERAKLHGRELQGILSSSAFEIERLQERVAQGDQVREALTKGHEELAQAEARTISVGERLELLRSHVEHLERRSAEAVGLKERHYRAEARIGEARNETAELERRLLQWRSAVDRETEIIAGYATLTQARERLRVLNTAGQTVLAMQRELSPIDQRVSSERATLEGEVRARQQQVENELTPKAAALPAISERLERIAGEVSTLDKSAEAAAQAVEEERALWLNARRLEAENTRLVEQGKETANKLLLLDHEHAEGVDCPLCGTPLEPDARARTQNAFKREIEEQRERFKTQADEIKSLDTKANGLTEQVRTLHQAVEAGRRELDAEQARLTLQRDEATQAQAQLGDATRSLAEMHGRLERGEYAVEEQRSAHDLRARIAELAFDAHAVGVAELSQREQEHWEADQQALAQAKMRLPEDEESLRRVSDRVGEESEELTRIKAQLEEIGKELADLDGYRNQRAAVTLEQQQAAGQRDELRTLTGALAHQLEEIAAAEAEIEKRELERKDIGREAGAYGELAMAFGKGGVQALLIEAAIPRLEDEANDLLKQMTAGRMSLKLETQRARRTGRAADGSESIETLEVLIADELGTRNYEMFSGGERFRVDFALRIALSKLLAWRAGAPLPTLFIDEGFGTQDAEGRDRILDVIKAIEDRFQRIIVITHMDEIKEAFPVRIEVTRTLEGSTFSIS